MDRRNRKLPRRLIAEVFEELATEVTDEVVFLENVDNLLPDATTLDNVRDNNNEENIQDFES